MWLRCDLCRRYGRLRLGGLHDVAYRVGDAAVTNQAALFFSGASQFVKTCLSRSTVCLHLGEAGWATVFWLPNKPTSYNRPLHGYGVKPMHTNEVLRLIGVVRDLSVVGIRLNTPWETLSLQPRTERSLRITRLHKYVQIVIRASCWLMAFQSFIKRTTRRDIRLITLT